MTVNNFAKSEEENETYVLPGTNRLVTAQYQQDIIERFNPAMPANTLSVIITLTYKLTA